MEVTLESSAPIEERLTWPVRVVLLGVALRPLPTQINKGAGDIYVSLIENIVIVRFADKEMQTNLTQKLRLEI